MNEILHIRKASVSDEIAVLTIFNQAIRERSNAHLEPLEHSAGAKWFERLIHDAQLLIVCESEGLISGWGALMPYRTGRGALSKTLEITFYVHRMARRKGVATGMIQYLEAEAKDRDILHMAAILLDDNEASKTILKKHGYFEWGNFKDVVHFEDGDRGHLYMGKNL